MRDFEVLKECGRRVTAPSAIAAAAAAAATAAAGRCRRPQQPVV